MSWIDQGRQQHGWFGQGTAPHVGSAEFGARAFAAAHFAAGDFAAGGDSPVWLGKTAETLRIFARFMAAEADLAPNAFRLRFFHSSFDPVDAWTIQSIMRDVAAADTHAELVGSGKALAATIRAHGPDGWTGLLGEAVAHLAPAPPTGVANGEANVQKTQFAPPIGPLALPLPPVFFPGTRENEKFADETIKQAQRLGSAIGGLFESRRHDAGDDEDEDGRRRPPRARPQSPQPDGAATQDGETRDKPPPGSKPIDQTQWSGDHGDIKDGVGAGGPDDVRISPDGDAWLKNPDGTWTKHDAARDYTGSGEPSGRTGRERDRRPGS